MARSLRSLYPGALHHVINRGGGRQAIFLDLAERQQFPLTLAEACVKAGWQVHAHASGDWRRAAETARYLPGVL